MIRLRVRPARRGAPRRQLARDGGSAARAARRRRSARAAPSPSAPGEPRQPSGSGSGSQRLTSERAIPTLSPLGQTGGQLATDRHQRQPSRYRAQRVKPQVCDQLRRTSPESADNSPHSPPGHTGTEPLKWCEVPAVSAEEPTPHVTARPPLHLKEIQLVAHETLVSSERWCRVPRRSWAHSSRETVVPEGPE